MVLPSLHTIVPVLLLMLLLLLLLILIACRPWRLFLSSSSRSRSSTLMIGDEAERPLVLNVLDGHDESNQGALIYDIEEACHQNDGLLRTPRMEGLVYKPRIFSTSSHVTPQAVDSLILEVAPDPVEDVPVGQTLKYSPLAGRFPDAQKHFRPDNQIPNVKPGSQTNRLPEFKIQLTDDQRSYLSLEVISGPSSGQQCSVESTSSSRLTVTLGRVSSDLLIKDSEKKKWEVVDMGSLNGTLLNSRPINHPDPASRQWGKPVELSSGDIITLGTTSKVKVIVTSKSENWMPFGVGMASDPMALRRGGKKLPMEDVCYYLWPLPGIHEFGAFGICDGHGGVAAAKSASKMLPEKVASVLSDAVIREKVISQGDASDILRIVFSQTEASMNNHYEGCTATLLLVWCDGAGRFFAQCANVGDSACVMKGIFLSVKGNQMKMTEDHRVTSYSERLRINGIGEPLRDGETRLCGLNLARMLGDKFLKQQDARFSSEPYVSPVVHIDRSSSCFAVLASDGFWDVISVKKAVHLVQQAKEKQQVDGENQAEKVANVLLAEAKAQRTKDNTSVIFLDFDAKFRSPSSCIVNS
ncbi:Protein phosphatase 2C 70 [Linum perenne]